MTVCCQRTADLGTVAEIVKKYAGQPGALLPALKEVQRAAGHLTTELLDQVAKGLNLPLSQVYGVASFYTLFSITPKGKYIIRVCESAPCHMVGARSVLKQLERELGIAAGETTPDGLFTLETTSCLGICAVAPAIMVNDQVHGNLSPDSVPEIVRAYREKGGDE